MDLKIRRRRRQRERHKGNRFKQNNNFARASHFFVHFFAVFARLRRENAISYFIDRGCKQATTKFSLSFLTWIRLLGIQLQESSRIIDKVNEMK